MNMELKFSIFLVILTCNGVQLQDPFRWIREGQDCEAAGQSFCSSDGRSILYCVGAGRPPITTECQGGTCCQIDPDSKKPVCVASENPTCGSQNDIVCFEYGEFPHPSLPDSTVKCGDDEGTEAPEKICKCNTGFFINPKVPGLPCVASPNPLYIPLSCKGVADNGYLLDPQNNALNFCYFCHSANTISINFCPIPSGRINNIRPYAPSDKICTAYDGNPGTTSTDSTATDSTTIESTSTESEPECSSSEELKKDDDDCHYYLKCDPKTQKFVRMRCGAGKYWNDKMKNCSNANEGKCAN